MGTAFSRVTTFPFSTLRTTRRAEDGKTSHRRQAVIASRWISGFSPPVKKFGGICLNQHFRFSESWLGQVRSAQFFTSTHRAFRFRITGRQRTGEEPRIDSSSGRWGSSRGDAWKRFPDQNVRARREPEFHSGIPSGFPERGSVSPWNTRCPSVVTFPINVLGNPYTSVIPPRRVSNTSSAWRD